MTTFNELSLAWQKAKADWIKSKFNRPKRIELTLTVPESEAETIKTIAKELRDKADSQERYRLALQFEKSNPAPSA